MIVVFLIFFCGLAPTEFSYADAVNEMDENTNEKERATADIKVVLDGDVFHNRKIIKKRKRVNKEKKYNKNVEKLIFCYIFSTWYWCDMVRLPDITNLPTKFEDCRHIRLPVIDLGENLNMACLRQ